MGQIDAYRTTAIMGSSQQRLVQLLYEGLVRNLQRGAAQMRARDIEGKCESLQKASDIVFELLSSLDFEAGGDLAGRLASLYAYWIRQIRQAGSTLQPESLDQVIEMASTLGEAWGEALMTSEGGAPIKPEMA